jgi:glycosyltransferase involved in cell wall biosynthesis
VRVLVVGNPAVVPALGALGHEVVVAHEAFPEEAYRVPGRPFDLGSLWPRLVPEPDLLLVVQQLGVQELPFGLEAVPAPRLYWAIDVHLNWFWQRHYARLFDRVLSTQRAHVALLEAEGVRAHWLPWGAEAEFLRERGSRRHRDLVFVGTVDAATRPKRAAAVALLERRFGMATFGRTVAERLSPEAMADVFASARIVFNEAVLGDLNFRVFEAMASGAMLLTERIDAGLVDLFTPGEHLDVFGPEDLVAKVEHWLAHEAERARVAASGAAEVRARHTLEARMAETVALVRAGIPRRAIDGTEALAWGLTCQLTVLRGLTHPREASARAVESLREALDRGRPEAAVALAEMLVWVGREEGALLLLADACGREPARLETWLLAAEVERRRGRADHAAALAREGIGQARGLGTATRARALEALAAGIDDASALHALGLALQETGLAIVPGLVAQVEPALPRTALDYYQRALAVDPGHRAAAESAAAVLELAGMSDFAVPFRVAAARAAPEDAAARAALGRTLLASYRAAAGSVGP